MIEKLASKVGFSRWLKIGVVGKAHGLNGAFFLSGRHQTLDTSVAALMVGSDPETGVPLTITKQRHHGVKTILQTSELSNRQQLETLQGQPVWCLRSSLAVDDEEYLWDDLLGCQVLDKDGTSLGVVVRLNNYGASDILEVEDTAGQTLAIPFVSTYFHMDFQAEDGLRLTVGADTFAGTWE